MGRLSQYERDMERSLCQAIELLEEQKAWAKRACPFSCPRTPASVLLGNVEIYSITQPFKSNRNLKPPPWQYPPKPTPTHEPTQDDSSI